MRQLMARWFAALAAFMLMMAPVKADQQIINLIAKVKPSLVAIGTHDPLRQPAADLNGTGFVVAEGSHILTALHVFNSRGSVPGGTLSAFVGSGEDGEIRGVTKVAEDAANDMVLLRLEGRSLPALSLNKAAMLPEGTDVLLSGFPIGAVFGLYPASHRAMISAHTRISRPAPSGGDLTPERIRALKRNGLVYQLDGTTLPGNSGGPVMDLASGEVIAVVNSSYVQAMKGGPAAEVSGIGFAIPIAAAIDLLNSAGLTP